MPAADVVQEMLERFNRGDYEGSTAVRGLSRWLSGFESGFQYLPEELIDCGERVFVRVLLHGVGRGSGVELSIWAFFGEAEARKAAGLAGE
ncbi:hypothetical protein BH20ACT15_BH20ACT15_02330 [soil metagenome]